MEKRQFLRASVLGAASGAAVLPGLARARTESKTTVGPTLLTVSGMIGPGNRGALDPALDQLMSKQKVEFNTAHAFDFSALTALPAVTIDPTLEYDNDERARRQRTQRELRVRKKEKGKVAQERLFYDADR